MFSLWRQSELGTKDSRLLLRANAPLDAPLKFYCRNKSVEVLVRLSSMTRI